MAEQPAGFSHDELITLIRQELADGVFTVPLLPHTASEVLASSLEEDSDAQRLADLIEKDQSLATQVLRVVNSPAFRGSAEIVALRQAIARLGMDRMREIALSVSVKGTVFKGGAHEAMLTSVWSQALSAGLWAKEIARRARKNVELAYLAGLLHTIGVPVLVNRAVELDASVTPAALETLLDTLTMEAGQAVVAAWHLPPIVGECMACAGAFEEADAPDLVAVNEAGQQVASHMADSETAAVDEEDVQEFLGEDAFQHLNFYPDDVAELLALAGQIETTVESLR